MLEHPLASCDRTHLMATSSQPRRPLLGRFLGSLLVVAFAITASGWITAYLAAQDPKKEEVEEPVKPKKKPPKVEEEEPVTKPRKVIPVPDDDPVPSKPRTKPPAAAPAEAQTSLVEALRDTKNPELRTLYGDLKTPHDAVTVSSTNGETRTYAVEPVSRYYDGEQTRFKNEYLQVWTYDREWRRSKSSTKIYSALEIQPYEEVVLKAVDAFLKKDLDRLAATNPSHLTRADMLKAAETVLAAADRFHASARETGARLGDEWGPIGQRLHERLFQVQLDRLDTYSKADDWDGATAYARALADAYREAKERTPIAARLVRMIEDELKVNGDEARIREARGRLRLLDEIFPGSEAMRPIANGLRAQAQNLFDRARGLKGNHQQKVALLELALDICPTLPGLAEALAKEQKDHPLLRVGVRDLPLTMIPGQATTDAELRAVELLYEGLVKLRVEPGVGQRYEAALAAGMPRLIPLGREFRIARGATWSDGTPVTVGDVKATLRAMRKKERWPGYSPLWDKMIEDPEGGGNSFRLSLHLSQGYLDPLSLMTFKVLPQSVASDAVLPFAKPLGSGPFKYVDPPITVGNRKAVVFVANPGYASREGKLGLPRIREIQFIHFAGPADDLATALAQDKIDLALDLSAMQFASLRGGPTVTRGPLPNRRVYFLAVNHRAPQIKGNVFLRRALALAINREAILNKYFRDKPGAKMHHALNGPFPAGSWPCDPKNVPAELYNPDEAKAQARKAVEMAHGPITLKLKYPSGDLATRAALQYLCTSVNNELRIDDRTFIALELQEPGVEPHKLREEVQRSHKYELAYYHYDHTSDAYWVAPLFDTDPRARDDNGSNYLGYIDGGLQSELLQAMNRRDFGEVQRTMRLVHRMLEQQMPLIPLWQLDTFLAYRKGLNPTSMDPLLIFNDVENWTLDPKR